MGSTLVLGVLAASTLSPKGAFAYLELYNGYCGRRNRSFQQVFKFTLPMHSPMGASDNGVLALCIYAVDAQI